MILYVYVVRSEHTDKLYCTLYSVQCAVEKHTGNKEKTYYNDHGERVGEKKI